MVNNEKNCNKRNSISALMLTSLITIVGIIIVVILTIIGMIVMDFPSSFAIVSLVVVLAIYVAYLIQIAREAVAEKHGRVY